MRIMNTDFFVRLIVATHKVVNILPKEDLLRTQVQDSANKLLVSLILLAQENPVAAEQRRTVAAKAIREIGELIAYLNYAKRIAQINPQNFVVLEREYNKVGEFLRKLHQSNTELAPYQAGSGAALSRSPKSFSPKPPKSDLGAPKSDLSRRGFKQKKRKGPRKNRELYIVDIAWIESIGVFLFSCYSKLSLNILLD